MSDLTISASSLSTFSRCSQQYKWQFLDKIEPEDGGVSIYAIFGTTLHKALELHFRYKLGLDELKKAWRSLIIAICTETKGLSLPSEKEFEENASRGVAQLENVQKMIERWEGYRVLDVEKYHRVPFDNKYVKNVFLSGRLDLVLKSDDGLFVCLDWKTSKTKDSDMGQNVQLTFYSMFVNDMYGCEFESIYGALAYPHDGEILFTQRSKEDVLNLYKQVNNMLERVNIKDFIKEPKLNTRKGDCFFCPYKKRCMND